MILENYLFDCEDTDPHKDEKIYVLVIYDIENNRKRTKLAKLLEGYGFRIQKSAFEAMLSKKKYLKLIDEIAAYGSGTDSIRVYKIKGKGEVTVFGEDEKTGTPEIDDIILI